MSCVGLTMKLQVNPYWVHGERSTIPVNGGSEAAKLLVDAVAVLLLPLPNLGNEGLSAEIVARLASLLGELLFDNNLGGNTGVITPRVPKDGLTPHSVPVLRFFFLLICCVCLVVNERRKTKLTILKGHPEWSWSRRVPSEGSR